jgi:RNA polymerase sigma-70 factor, ECF subfamily
MSSSAQIPSTPRWAAKLKPELQQCFQRSGAERFGVTEPVFARILMEVAVKYLPAGADAHQARELLATVHVEELALARGCAAGNEAAWEVFLTRYREKLYDAARGITREDATARELADSLYANLYGLGGRDGGARVSKLTSYMGRGSLEGWLRTVLAQEFINRYRTQRRLVSLDEEAEAGVQFEAPQPALGSTADTRLEAATDEVLAALPAEERFILASYFLDERTLAEIARTLGVHESTISRKLEKITRGLRGAIRDALVRRGMSRRQADEALEVDVRDLAVDVRARLAAAGDTGRVEQRKAET